MRFGIFLLSSLVGLFLALHYWPFVASTDGENPQNYHKIESGIEKGNGGGTFPMFSHPRGKRDVGHALKSFGVTILALLGVSVAFGLDYGVTTVLTPLMIITLTKNIDIKAIIGKLPHKYSILLWV
jgi:hypothetical protein